MPGPEGVAQGAHQAQGRVEGVAGHGVGPGVQAGGAGEIGQLRV
ncbi:hypothetical protein AB7952_00010 [Streptomyces sp. PG2]